MSQIQPIGTPDVRATIARAAQATGVDFDYLLAQARLESSLDPSAQAGTSSAAGLYQFTGGTWMQTLQRHGAEHGLTFSRDPAARGTMMALRFDAGASALMAGELANDNKAALGAALGRAPDAAELYLAHFLGSEGAIKFLSADPGQSAASLMPAAAAANRGVFYDKAGAARSVGSVMELLRGKLGTAMEGTGLPSPSGEGIEGWGLSAYATLTQNDMPQPNPVSGRPVPRTGLGLPGAVHPETPEGEGRTRGPVATEFLANRPAASMADTLNTAFGPAAPGFVRAAYGQMKALGL